MTETVRSDLFALDFPVVRIFAGSKVVDEGKARSEQTVMDMAACGGGVAMDGSLEFDE